MTPKLFADLGKTTMAITDAAEYAHLREVDLEALGVALEAIRRDIENSRGEQDRTYIQRAIAFQRGLDLAARLVIAASRSGPGWALGTAALATAKSIENMELGHNICHGQWDWMNDPEIHSSTWEWDMVGVSSQWRYAHNYRHHVFTNVIGEDDDLGYGIMRVTRDQQWRCSNLLQPLRSVLLAIMFEWGIALQGWESQQKRAAKSALTRALVQKVACQAGKDYLIFPALSLRRWRRTLTANAAANLLRNVWAYVVICCGHLGEDTQKFAPDALNDESKSEWYLRQMLGTANFRAGPVLAFLSGNLCYQIEHHLFPDLPSNRYAQIAPQVRSICARFDLPYTTGPLARQYLGTVRTIFKLALPDRLPAPDADGMDAHKPDHLDDAHQTMKVGSTAI
ncbi:fatty acid desaturase (plasmid) [Mycobacterium branderi]|nr:fatty acid desaturase [Mycobacterium branderi]